MTAGPEVSHQLSSPDNPALADALFALKASENRFRHSDGELRAFSKKHMAVVNGRSVFLGDSILSGQQLREEYLKLLRQRDVARTAFMASMAAYARVQTGTNFQVGVLER